ncbi:unnamed protein product [marine sediment metagenome]|uniref:Uncharacterized protein n=1 Tax=marine sediment metagenome TaxID=412755 RepID=X0VCT4_9ZZZZ
MANALYDKGRDKFLNGDIDYTADTLRVYLIDTDDYTVDLVNHEFLSEVAAGSRVAYAVLAGKSTAAGVADATDTVLSSVTGDQSEALLLCKYTGTDSTSALFGWIDTATGLPVTPNGGDITITWDDGANKIFKL